jgi:hypothetical protein
LNDGYEKEFNNWLTKLPEYVRAYFYRIQYPENLQESEEEEVPEEEESDYADPRKHSKGNFPSNPHWRMTYRK